MIPNNFWNIDRVTDEKQFKSQLSLILKDFYNILNRGIIFGDNNRCAIINQAVVVGENQITHNLGYTANNYILTGSSVANQSLYDGTTSNTKSTIYLNATQAGSVRLLIF